MRAACPSPIVPRPSIGTPPAADPSVTSLALPAKSPRLNMKDECVYIYIYLFIKANKDTYKHPAVVPGYCHLPFHFAQVQAPVSFASLQLSELS